MSVLHEEVEGRERERMREVQSAVYARENYARADGNADVRARGSARAPQVPYTYSN